MSLLILAFRRQQIICRRNSIQLRLMELQKKLMDYQTYAASISKGSITMSDLMDCPSSLFGRMTNFMFSSDQSARFEAQQKFGYMSQLYGAQMQNPMMQQAMFKSLYEQGRERFNQVETKLLSKVDTQIEQEMARLNTQLKMLDAEEQSVTQGEDNAAKNSAPKYA